MAAQDLVAGVPVRAGDGSRRRAAFLDRDGVINVDHGYAWRIEEFDFIAGALEAAATLARAGYALVVVTNQAGIGRGMYTEADFAHTSAWMRERFAAAGAPLDAVYHCPHHPTLALDAWRIRCECRKPAPGMLLAAAKALDLDLAGSVIFGDRCDDLRAGAAAGLRLRVLLGKDGLALPTLECGDAEGGSGEPLASARHISLAHALSDPALRHQLGLDTLEASKAQPSATHAGAAHGAGR
jgi:D-glycero-D-manno-heptose 1,7-bisphosphate phosphatase